MIESVLALLNIGVVAGIIGTTLYYSFAKTWIHFSLYEGLYCIAEKASVSSCERKTIQRINKLLPLPPHTRINLRQNSDVLVGEVRLGRTREASWKNQINQRVFEYELRLRNPEQDYRKVR